MQSRVLGPSFRYTTQIRCQGSRNAVKTLRSSVVIGASDAMGRSSAAAALPTGTAEHAHTRRHAAARGIWCIIDGA
jgi:hypothetical protein